MVTTPSEQAPSVRTLTSAGLQRLLDEQRRRNDRQLGIGDLVEGHPDLDRAVLERARSSDPAVARAAVRELRPAVERLEEIAVRRARARGWRWAEIGRVSGRSRQAVHRRYARPRIG